MVDFATINYLHFIEGVKSSFKLQLLIHNERAEYLSVLRDVYGLNDFPPFIKRDGKSERLVIISERLNGFSRESKFEIFKVGLMVYQDSQINLN